MLEMPDRWRVREVSWLLIAWLAGCLALALWLEGHEPFSLRHQLKAVHFWSLELGFVVVSILTVWNVRSIALRIDWRPRDVSCLLAILLLALVLLTSVAPSTSRIFYDEQIYLNIGQNLSDLRQAQMCNEGNVEYGRLQCNRGEYNKQPYGYPYLLSLVFRLFGVSESAAFAFNKLCLLVQITLVWITSLLLFKDRASALFAALICALIPQQLLWGATAAVEPSAATAVMASMLSTVWFCLDRSTPALLWMVAVTAFACQFRPESLLCVPLMLLVILALRRRELVRPRLYFAGLLGLLMTANLIGHLMAVRFESWGTTGPRMSVGYLFDNLRVNGWFYLKNVRFPAIYSILAVLGALEWRRRRALVPAMYFVSFWSVFLFFYAGSYNYGADIRYSLMSYAPLAMLAGRGVGVVLSLGHSRPRFALATAVGLLAFNFLSFMPLVRAEGEEAWSARADVEYGNTIAELIPPDGILLTQTPHIFQVRGVNAAQTSFAVNEADFVGRHLSQRYQGGIYFHWNFWCNVSDPGQVALCTRLLDRYPHRLVDETRRRDHRYALYRLEIDDTDSRRDVEPRETERRDLSRRRRIATPATEGGTR